MTAALGRAFALAIPAFVVAQFLLVGLGVFADGAAWNLHRSVGAAMALPVLGLAILACTTPALLPLRSPASALAGLYAMQFGWLGLGAALDIPALRAAHAVNGLAIAATGDVLLRRLRQPVAAIG
ncbi:hypothetical protein KPL78_00770 [Roseomonas sp. HJA6]|uniref:Uncharacterized protein n=1 Tax=Roseomonas alba TaxID=2846776 RepID=A0ABS7A2G4_9PROT|nr:hypothetical protein [Neoroseomonas alba]